MINGPGKHSVKSRTSEVTMAVATAGAVRYATKTFRPDDARLGNRTLTLSWHDCDPWRRVVGPCGAMGPRLRGSSSR